MEIDPYDNTREKDAMRVKPETIESNLLKFIFLDEEKVLAAFTTKDLPREAEGESRGSLVFRGMYDSPDFERISKRLVIGGSDHGDVIHVVDENYLSIPTDLRPRPPDGFITNLRETPLAHRAADCAIIAIHSDETGSIGTAHSGWKGTRLDIGAKLVLALSRSFGARPELMRAVISPYADPKLYEVGEDVYEAFLSATDEYRNLLFPESILKKFFIKDSTREGKYFFDHGALIRFRLLYSGITAENIFVSEHKTISEPDLFASARLDKENRRDNIMLAMLR